MTSLRDVDIVSAGGVRVEIRGKASRDVAQQCQLAALRDVVPWRLMGKDATLWGPNAEAEASIRLGWLDLAETSRRLLPPLAKLTERVRATGCDHVVLAGMGGSSLAPEVITRTAGVELTVLDTTDPDQVRRALTDRLDRTVVVVASKSGATIETDSHRRAYEQAFRELGLSDQQIAARFVMVTDPGSPLETLARAAGYSVVLADPQVGGRYSALSAFGLVPSALAGVDVATLLDTATHLALSLARDRDNPGLVLGAALGGVALAGRDKLVIADAGSAMAGFEDWIEQLIAESTGKNGRGLLPVVVEGIDAPQFADAGPDAHLITLGWPGLGEGTTVSGPLGAQFLLWEYATAVASRILGVNPFDQPNVQESKDNTAALLEKAGDGPLPEDEPVCVDDAIAIYGDRALVGSATTVRDAVRALTCTAPRNGYLAAMAYLDRGGQPEAAQLRPALARQLAGRPVTFGWGPRFLHSTGQYHKGGPPSGVFLQITGAVAEDLPVPGRPYSFGQLQLAQALGDLNALTARGRPTLRLHLRDRQAGLQQLLTVIEQDVR